MKELEYHRFSPEQSSSKKPKFVVSSSYEKWSVRLHVWQPPTDLYETDKEFIVQVEIAGMSEAEDTGLAAVAGGISEALVATAFGLFVAVPAVWMYNYFTSKIESFIVEMDNSSSELVDYFLKRREGKKHGDN